MARGDFTSDPAAGGYAAGDEDQLSQEDTLIDRGVADVLDEGYSPPERPYGSGAFGSGETLDQRLAEEEPDPAARVGDPLDRDDQWRSNAAEREAEFPQRREVGQRRAGRLVAPDLGFGEDTEADLIAQDVGISGGAASAEEAAIHIIDIEDEDTDENEDTDE